MFILIPHQPIFLGILNFPGAPREMREKVLLAGLGLFWHKGPWYGTLCAKPSKMPLSWTPYPKSSLTLAQGLQAGFRRLLSRVLDHLIPPKLT